MYHHLRGRLASVHPTRLVLEVGGVGYELLVPLSTSRKAGAAGNEITLLTHLLVREDALQLVGFATEEERDLFRTLIGLSGIGPALGLQILSSAPPREFALAIERQDAGFLTRIKGIGPKTAKRIILELKGAKTLLPPEEDETPLPDDVADAVAALETMGLSRKEAAARIEAVRATHPDLGLEDLIRQSLR